MSIAGHPAQALRHRTKHLSLGISLRVSRTALDTRNPGVVTVTSVQERLSTERPRGDDKRVRTATPLIDQSLRRLALPDAAEALRIPSGAHAAAWPAATFSTQVK